MLRRMARRAGLVVVGLGIMAAIACAYLLRDLRPRIERRRAQILSVTSTSAASDSTHRVELVRLRSASGLEVELAVKRPASGTGGETEAVARPLVILLGGHRTGRDAVHLIDDTRGIVVAALSYPYDGNHRAKGLEIVSEVPAIRRAILDTPAALMLALDYLIAQPYVDRERVEAVGVSLGAPFITIAGALDQRISRVWVVHGSGGAYTPLEFNLRRQLGSRVASIPIAGVASMLISGPRLAPEEWVADIAPRPVVMSNAIDDERLPRAAIARLYGSASEPKEMIWVPGGHVRSEAEAVRPLVALVLDRILTEPLALGAGSGSVNRRATLRSARNLPFSEGPAGSTPVDTRAGVPERRER
jgi:dienelactone hydrolase